MNYLTIIAVNPMTGTEFRDWGVKIQNYFSGFSKVTCDLSAGRVTGKQRGYVPRFRLQGNEHDIFESIKAFAPAPLPMDPFEIFGVEVYTGDLI